MLYICLSFDYELFFNDSYASEREILIDPARNICKALEEAGTCGTFFVDVPSVFSYKKNGMTNFPCDVETQLKEMIHAGHDVQLHFHPIWYKSYPTENGWKFDNNFYRIDQYTSSELNIEEELCKAKSYLENVCKQVKQGYKCIAFRAGGFCFQPEMKLLDILYKMGIRIESSVFMKASLDSEIINYDFRDIPDKLGWYISSEGGIKQESVSNKSQMLEVPVGSYGKVPQKWMLTHGAPKLNFPPLKGKGTPVNAKKHSKNPVINRIITSIKTPVQFSFDHLHYTSLEKMVERYIKMYNTEVNDAYVCVIGHPKLCRGVYCENMREFVLLVKKLNLPVSFVTMQDIYNKINI